MTDVCHWDDVAHYQGAFRPTRAVVAKATQGTGFKDEEYPGNKYRAAAGDHHFAGYHFLEDHDAPDQASFAHSVMGSVPGMLDVEQYKVNGVWHWPSLADTVSFIKSYRADKGVMNVTYIPHWFWVRRWHSVSLKPLADLGMHNINSDYSNASDAEAMANFGGLDVFARQYTSTPHDMNRALMPFEKVWGIFTGKAPVSYRHPAGSRMLKLASPLLKGHDVKVVQQKVGQARAGLADGEYGSHTKSGVEWWQRNHRLDDDGIVGPRTWASFGVKYTGK